MRFIQRSNCIISGVANILLAVFLCMYTITTVQAGVCFLPNGEDCAEGQTKGFWPGAKPDTSEKCDSSYSSTSASNACGVACEKCTDQSSRYYGLYKCPTGCNRNCDDYTSDDRTNKCGMACEKCLISGDKNFGLYKCPAVPAGGCGQCKEPKYEKDSEEVKNSISECPTWSCKTCGTDNLYYNCEQQCNPDDYSHSISSLNVVDKEKHCDMNNQCGCKVNCDCFGYNYRVGDCPAGQKPFGSCTGIGGTWYKECVAEEPEPEPEPEPELGSDEPKYTLYNYVDIWVTPYSIDGKIPGTSGTTLEQTLYTYAYIEDSNMELGFLRLIPFAVNSINGRGSNDYPSENKMRDIGLKPVRFDRGYFETIPGTSYSTFYKHSDLPTGFKEINKSEFNDLYFQLFFYNSEEFKEEDGIREVGNNVYECHKKAEILDGAKIATCEFETSVLKDSDNNGFVAKYIVRMSMDAIPGRTCPTGFSEARDVEQCYFNYDWLRADYKDNNCYSCTCNVKNTWKELKDTWEGAGTSEIDLDHDFDNEWFLLNHSGIYINFDGAEALDTTNMPDYKANMHIDFYAGIHGDVYEDEGHERPHLTYNNKPYNIEITYPAYDGSRPYGSRKTNKVVNYTTESSDALVNSVFVPNQGQGSMKGLESFQIKITHPDFEGWSEMVKYIGTSENGRWYYLNGGTFNEYNASAVLKSFETNRYQTPLNDYDVTAIVDELDFITPQNSQYLYEDNVASALYKQDVYYNGQFRPFIIAEKHFEDVVNVYQVYIPLIECGTYIKFEFDDCQLPIASGNCPHRRHFDF